MNTVLWNRRCVMERRQFTREFKLEAVRLIKQRGVSYAQASQDLVSSEPGAAQTIQSALLKRARRAANIATAASMAKRVALLSNKAAREFGP
jgi:transposase-like protein